jgi:pyruvate ferredoxin oxidoreductase alpha subunit
MHDHVLVESQAVIEEVWADFAKEFGRTYRPVETYRADGAEYLLLTVGGLSQTASVAVDQLRDRGVKVGQLKLRLWRPFPHREIHDLLAGVKGVIVFDRCLSVAGTGGPVATEIKAALFNRPTRPVVVGLVGGLGGRDVTTADFAQMIEKGIGYIDRGEAPVYEMVGVRE